MIRLYKDHIEKAEELLVLAKMDESKALSYLYRAIVEITQAVCELERPL